MAVRCVEATRQLASKPGRDVAVPAKAERTQRMEVQQRRDQRWNPSGSGFLFEPPVASSIIWEAGDAGDERRDPTSNPRMWADAKGSGTSP